MRPPAPFGAGGICHLIGYGKIYRNRFRLGLFLREFKDGGRIIGVENTEGEKLTPSTLCFTADGVFAGTVADEYASSGSYFSRFKRYLGDPEYTAEAEGKELSASALTALVLKKLVNDAELQLGDTIAGAVIACPANFGDAARAALKEAGEAVTLSDGKKLKVLQLIGEDVAAANAYAASAHGDINKTILLLDLGGGSFRCSVVKLLGEKCDVLTSATDPELGGTAWDEKVLGHVCTEFCRVTETNEEELRAAPEFEEFRRGSEALKKFLATNATATKLFTFGGKRARIEMTAAQFEECTSDLFMRVRDCIDAMLKESKLKANDVDEVVLTGGGARMQLAQDQLGAYGKACIVFDPDKAVANGAAILAQKYAEATLARGEGEAAGAVVLAAQTVRATKSYGLKCCDSKKDSNGNYCNIFGCANLIFKDDALPAKGLLSDYFKRIGQESRVIIEAGHNSVWTTILENDSRGEKLIPYEECEELYEDAEIEFEEPFPVDTFIDIELALDVSGLLTLTLIETETGKRHPMYPVRKGGNAASKGMEEVANFKLG